MFSHMNNETPIQQVDAWEGLQSWVYFVQSLRLMTCALQDLAQQTENQTLEVGEQSLSNSYQAKMNEYQRTIDPVQIWALGIYKVASVNDLDSLTFCYHFESLWIQVKLQQLWRPSADGIAIGQRETCTCRIGWIRTLPCSGCIL